MSIRPVKKLVKSKPTLEGAGVHLRRAFGFGNTKEVDPFLLLDDFRNDVPEDYLAGFPWHPHRGIETITYVLAGTVQHGDSMGNSGVIGAGDVQWMTAGSGIIHQEMPKGDQAGRMHGFQLWGNLPSSLKMTSPRYQEVNATEVPEITDDDGTHVRVVCGQFWGKKGPVDGVAADPIYLDVSVAPGHRKTLPVETTRSAFAYVFAGSGKFCNASGPLAVPTEAIQWLDTAPPVEADNRSLILFDRGDEVSVQAGEDGIRFLLVSGKPLEEPVAWYGPIVMNTQEQLRQAFTELREGTFLKSAQR
jgi:redox-sensitive bicupin YhaK (pirin superfamily)